VGGHAFLRVNVIGPAPGICLGVLCLLGCSEPRLHHALLELNAAEQRWRADAPPAYQFTVQRLCFCAAPVTRPVTVFVRATLPSGVVYADSGTVADSTLFREFLTIDRLFDFVRRTIAQTPDTLVAAYDPRLGYPIQISVDFRFGVADYQLSVTVTGFQAVGTLMGPR